jgi:alpha-amylase
MNYHKVIVNIVNTVSLADSAEDLEGFYQSTLKGVLTLLFNAPEVRGCFYFSGILLQWLESRHPEYLMVLSEMIKRKQVDILGGAFFEPCIPLIAPQDRLGQIEMLTTLIRRIFNKRPRGYWLQPQIWDQVMASILNNSGMEFTFLKWSYFRQAGALDSDYGQPAITEDQGKTITVFPLNPDNGSVTSAGTNGNYDSRVFYCCPVDDSERLSPSGSGVLPALEEFVSSVRERKNMRTLLPEKILKNSNLNWNRLYFPAAVHDRKSDAGKERSYRHLLIEYPEAGFLYGKMNYVSILTNQIRGDKSRKKISRESLWKGQSIYGYSNGCRKGITDIQSREECWFSLLEAEKITRERATFRPGINSLDLDMDGRKEYLYQGLTLNAYVHRLSGMLFELDYLPDCRNYLNTLSSGTVYRKAFIDHLYGPEECPGEDPADIIGRDKGNLHRGGYNLESLNRENNSLMFHFKGELRQDSAAAPIEIKKKYVFKRGLIEIYYGLINPSAEDLSFRFGSEINLSLPDSTDGFDNILAGLVDDNGFELYDEKPQNSLSFHLTHPCELKTYLIREKGKYQSHCLLPLWEIRLGAGQSFKMKITLKIAKNKPVTVKDTVEPAI